MIDQDEINDGIIYMEGGVGLKQKKSPHNMQKLSSDSIQNIGGGREEAQKRERQQVTTMIMMGNNSSNNRQ